MNRRIRTALAASVIVVGGVAAAVTTTTMAHADTKICEQYGSTTIGGKYVVMNNRWGTTAEHCINVTSTGFSIATQQGNSSSGPVSYPAIFVGCHYTNCSPGTNLPMQIGSIGSATSSINYTYVGGTYDAAYDIWLDPTAKKDGVNRTEIMIWFNRTGSVQPIGSPGDTTTIGGKQWQVWRGSNGTNDVISFMAPSAISSWNFSVLDFLNETVRRGLAQQNWYLTSIQAGFEPWSGGVGLAVNSFSASVTSGNNNPSSPAAPSSPASSPAKPSSPASSPSSQSGNGSCSVAYKTNSWGSGFTADLTVKAGNQPINGWTLKFDFPGDQKITSSWSATVTQSGKTVTATNAGYNGSIAANGSTSFGFQGTYSGSNGTPSGFSVNGTACSAA